MSVSVAAIPQPSETGDICRELTEQLPTKTINAAISPAARDRVAFDAKNTQIETKATTAKQAIDEVIPLLKEMREWLSQRGAERLREAGLPTWTEYYETFREKFGLKSLRTFQRQLAKESDDGDAPPPSPREPRKPFVTGAALDAPILYQLLDEILSMIEKRAARESLEKRGKEMREDMKAGLAPTAHKAKPSSPAPRLQEKQKAKNQIEVDKLVKKEVAGRRKFRSLFDRQVPA